MIYRAMSGDLGPGNVELLELLEHFFLLAGG
jgi:hypothetical protein